MLVDHVHDGMIKVKDEGTPSNVVTYTLAVLVVAFEVCSRARACKAASRDHVIHPTHSLTHSLASLLVSFALLTHSLTQILH